MLWYYGVILKPLIVGIVLVLVLVLEATVGLLETSLASSLVSKRVRSIQTFYANKRRIPHYTKGNISNA